MVSTAQYLTELATELSARGHDVTVIAGDRGYDDPARRFPRRETWNNIEIIRIPSLSLGKSSRWRRVFNFGSFAIVCALRLLLLRRFDVVVALTSPPLISFLGALFVRLKGGSFCFWVMDLNPDEAIAAGWLAEGSVAARCFKWMLRYSIKHATQTIVLDRFMRDRVLAKGADARRVVVIPPWSHDDAVEFSVEGREAFRREHGLSDRFVVMYAGNHSPCHPLDTLLLAALQLKTREDVAFCFVGGGSEQAKVRDFALQHELSNVKCVPYQPLDQLAGSLSAADLHVVVMGDEFVGIVHPCKIYNIMAVGAPALYIGPQPSHITDLASQNIFLTRHGDVGGVAESILLAREQQGRVKGAGIFRKERILPQLVNAIGGNSFENLFRPLPDSDSSFVDYHAAHPAAVSTVQATRHPN
ncbi:MAG TPA: glycosyltransferase family 4 protein [Pyrinomonadaceae bacterium]|nr:glycosyltransferase family 4 protein [Pyrinomonadaceae bacterium]